MQTEAKLISKSNRIRRSEKLTEEDKRKFLLLIDSYETKTDVFEEIGLTRPTFYSVLKKGSGRTPTVRKIREAIKKRGIH